MNVRISILVFMTTVTSLLLAPFTCLAEVEGGCTMCHKYPGFGRIETTEGEDTKRIKRLFYINNDLFESTYHGKIACKNCHTGVNKIPHTDAPVVNCAADCHIMDPSSGKAFSHRKIVDDFNNSAHGKEGSLIEDKSDLPVCKDCHNNRTYHATIGKQTDSKHQVTVCQECHESEEFVQRFYEHIMYRTSKRRSSKDVVGLCSTCHADLELMEKAGLDAVVGFSSTFHARAIKYGNEEVANCLNCHAPYQLGFSPHRIISSKKKHSPVNVENKIETCRQSDCHAGATEDFALGGRVHPSPEKINFLITDKKLGKGEELSTGESKLVDDPVFQARVIGWIQIFYKFLIIVVIGGLGLHRILDMYATSRERRMRED